MVVGRWVVLSLCVFINKAKGAGAFEFHTGFFVFTDFVNTIFNGCFYVQVVAVVVSITDMVSDLWITVVWWKEGSYSFFAISICIFLIAAFAYAALILSTLAQLLTTRHRVMWFIGCLFFGQFVPVLHWFVSLNIPRVTAWLEQYNLGL